jgi:hypothetical protein
MSCPSAFLASGGDFLSLPFPCWRFGFRLGVLFRGSGAWLRVGDLGEPLVRVMWDKGPAYGVSHDSALFRGPGVCLRVGGLLTLSGRLVRGTWEKGAAYGVIGDGAGGRHGG